jgi:twitching motility protein PilT
MEYDVHRFANYPGAVGSTPAESAQSHPAPAVDDESTGPAARVEDASAPAETATQTGPVTTTRTAAEEGFSLPPSYRRILREAPRGYFGTALVRWYAEQLDAVPFEDQDLVRDYFERLARKMIEVNASDLEFGGPGCSGRIWYRVDGEKHPDPEAGSFDLNEIDLMLLTLLAPFQQEKLFTRYAIDFGYSLDVGDGDAPRRFRSTMYHDNQHLALSMRMLAWKPRSLHSLGFHPLIERGFMFRYVRDGLTLFTGVTGSGKSTTLDAIIDANNEDFPGQILLVAQPIEYIHESKRCVMRHREVGVDVESFVDGMTQGLRQDPDIVVVGEMRDPETISTALELADTGHKVFSTLHTPSAIETIDRIVAEYPSAEQERVQNRLADVLRCVISQKLLPAVGGGRILAKEVLWMTPSSRAAIKNGNTGEIYQMIWEGSDQGMVTLEQDLLRLVRTGEIMPDTALGYANNKRRLLQLLK